MLAQARSTDDTKAASMLDLRLLTITTLFYVAQAHAPALASDACAVGAIETAADVSVSDGSTFSVQSLFQSKDAAAHRQISAASEMLISTEGPIGWVRIDDATVAATASHKQFALGHQFHALLLHFDDIVENPRDSSVVKFIDRERRARTGDLPYGGVAHLIQGDIDDRAAGMVFEFPNAAAPIIVIFKDWRTVDGIPAPFAIEIDDGERLFKYQYVQIDIGKKSPLWYFDTVAAPPLDDVNIYRLHRSLLAAHCLGDADMMADLSAEEVTVANRGVLSRDNNANMRDRFRQLFSRIEYDSYRDLAPPIIKISKEGDLGWIAVQVAAEGRDIETNRPFEDQWAWVMLVEKIDGEWKHVGNSSNRAP